MDAYASAVPEISVVAASVINFDLTEIMRRRSHFQHVPD